MNAAPDVEPLVLVRAWWNDLADMDTDDLESLDVVALIEELGRILGEL